MTDTATRHEQWEAVRIRPRRLCHGNLFVNDLRRSAAFYQEVCGLTLVFEEPGISAVFLSNGNSHHDVALMEVSDQERIGRDGQVQVAKGRGRKAKLNHLGFEMETESQLVSAYERAVAAEIRIHRTADHQIAHSVYLFDPEGTYLEFYADAGRDWRAIYEEVGDRLLTGLWDPTETEPMGEPHYDPEPAITRVDDAPLHPVRSARAALVVSDLERALHFYRDVIGLTVLFGDADQGVAVLGGALGLPDLSLLRARADLPPGLHHFGLQLADIDELESAVGRLQQSGTSILARIDVPWKQSVVIGDPDGFRLEFFVPADHPVPDQVQQGSFDPLLV
jgi:catechol 2,3-dioxygenase